jgi:hypothetical protein
LPGSHVVAGAIAPDRFLAGPSRELASDRAVDRDVARLAVVRRVIGVRPRQALRDGRLAGVGFVFAAYRR